MKALRIESGVYVNMENITYFIFHNDETRIVTNGSIPEFTDVTVSTQVSLENNRNILVSPIEFRRINRELRAFMNIQEQEVHSKMTQKSNNNIGDIAISAVIIRDVA